MATSLPTPQAPFIYYFLYDGHYDCEEFEKLFPRATKVGLACLQGWVWHINVKGTLPARDIGRTADRLGKQNIRKMFYNGEDPSQNGTRSVTYGWVYRVVKEDEGSLHGKYGVDRVRMGQCVTVKHPYLPSAVAGLPVILYWDPRNTRDGWNWNKWSSSGAEQLKWMKAAASLKGAGVPKWYIEHVLDTAKRAKPYYTIHDNYAAEDSTIYCNPQDLHYTPPTTSTPPPPLRPYSNQGRVQGQATIDRAVKATPRSQPTPSGPKSVSRPQPIARPQSSTAPQPAVRLQPVSRPQSGPRPNSATGPQSANPQSGARARPTNQRSTIPTPTGPGPNAKVVKKRKSDSSADGGQPLKKPMNKKPPPGPSNLRHGTPA
jgi:hypothetical protein